MYILSGEMTLKDAGVINSSEILAERIEVEEPVETKVGKNIFLFVYIERERNKRKCSNEERTPFFFLGRIEEVPSEG